MEDASGQLRGQPTAARRRRGGRKGERDTMTSISVHPNGAKAGKPWLTTYPDMVPAELPPPEHASLAELLEKSCATFPFSSRIFGNANCRCF